jgi:hypothetical protein
MRRFNNGFLEWLDGLLRSVHDYEDEREFVLSCDEKAEMIDRTREEFKQKPGRNSQFTIEQKKRICTRMVALLATDCTHRECYEIIARECGTGIKPRAIKYEWEHRLEIGFRY